MIGRSTGLLCSVLDGMGGGTERWMDVQTGRRTDGWIKRISRGYGDTG